MPTAIIMIGLPGAGKTTWVKANCSDARVCSADHFHEKSGEYKFDPKNAPLAHGECIRNFVEHCRSHFITAMLGQPEGGTPVHLQMKHSDVVVDNTNVNVHSIAPYVGIAKAYGFTTRLVMVRPPSDAFERCLHKMPEAHWIVMRGQLNDMLAKWPTIWGELEVVMS
jgi:hypothetical protein